MVILHSYAMFDRVGKRNEGSWIREKWKEIDEFGCLVRRKREAKGKWNEKSLDKHNQELMLFLKTATNYA